MVDGYVVAREYYFLSVSVVDDVVVGRRPYLQCWR